MFSKGDLIYAYTRKQAIADGVLVDVSATAREAGFVVPVAVSAAAWAEYVAVPAGTTDQDEDGRLWDVLCMLRHAIRAKAERGEPELRFWLTVRNDNRGGIQPLTELKAVCGPDDDAAPCVTVMLPDED